MQAHHTIHYVSLDNISWLVPKSAISVSLACNPGLRPSRRSWRLREKLSPKGVTHPEPQVRHSSLHMRGNRVLKSGIYPKCYPVTSITWSQLIFDPRNLAQQAGNPPSTPILYLYPPNLGTWFLSRTDGFLT